MQKTGDPWPENWKVKDGVIYLTGLMRPHLVTTKEYGDFEMKFEWRALRDKYNSGFFIRCKPDAGNNQINLAKGAEGGFVGGKVDGAKPVPEFSAVKDQVEAFVMRKAQADYIGKLRQSAKIERMDKK